MTPSLRVAHVITGLGLGGAETMLYQMLANLEQESHPSLVISLGDGGYFAERIRRLDIPVKTLNLQPAFPNPLKIRQLRDWLRDFQPDLVQTWMYHADLIGGLAARLAGQTPVVWGIHNSTLDSNLITPTHFVRWVSARISKRLPTAIIACSVRAQEVHVQLGYPSEKMILIPNGFDLQQFKPNPKFRRDVRNELGIAKTAIVIGMVARFHPQKDYPNFIEAAGLLSATRSDLHYLLCGEGVSSENKRLISWLRKAGLSDHVHLLGLRNDIPRLLNAMDLFTLSSAFGEAFPLVVGEAMATGLPSVVTDVGDSAFLVDRTGLAVPPKEPHALAEAWNKMLAMPLQKRRELGKAARKRIKDHYGIDKITRDYYASYRNLIDAEASASRNEH